MHPNALPFLSQASVKTNSCRSQMAHGLLQSFSRGLEVHSARTKPADKMNPKAIEVCIELSNHNPKSVEIYLNGAWD